MIHIDAQTSASGFVEENGVVPRVSLDEGAMHSSTALFQRITRKAVDMHPESGGQCPNSEFEMGLQGKMSETDTSKSLFSKFSCQILSKREEERKLCLCITLPPSSSSLPGKAIYLCCCWRGDLWAWAGYN